MANRREIKKLSSVMIDRIAAGEVIEGPSSVAKELIENALDAGAQRLEISTGADGIDFLVIRDNGDGIPYSELALAVEKHATSKISDIDEIFQVESYGFRGEALASIASVSHLKITSRAVDSEIGGMIEVRGGAVIEQQAEAVPVGTVIEVRELFYSTPARKKFLKSRRFENAKIHREVIKAALARYDVEFIFRRDSKEIFNLKQTDRLLERIRDIYGSQLAGRLVPLSISGGDFGISGYISGPGWGHANRDYQFFFVNGRAVEIKNGSVIVRRALGELIPHGSHPAVFLYVQCDPGLVDVNVHPGKREVRFNNESQLQGLIYRAVENGARVDRPLSMSQARGHWDGPEKNPGETLKATEENRLFAQNENSFYRSAEVYSMPGGKDRSGSLESRETGVLYGVDSNTAPEMERAVNQDGTQSGEQSGFLPLRHFGLFFGTYILAEAADGIYLIDQHTAHERVNYERMRRSIEQGASNKQLLLHPIVLKVSPDELAHLLEHATRLERMGFQIEEIGVDSLVVREVPEFIEPGGEADALLHVLQRAAEGETGIDIYNEYAALKACKGSIKKNDRIPGEVISEILLQLSKCKDPTRCPHGRPTMIKLTRQEIDSMFQRR